MGSAVEEIAASLVREYLSRKGLKRTIVCMDEELPRTASSINNRTDLRRILHLDVLYKENKALEVPFKSMLEIIVKQQMEPDRDSMAGCGSAHQTVSYKQHMPVSDSALVSHIRVCDILEEEREESTAVSDYSQIDVKRSPNSEDIFPSNVFLSSQSQTCFTKATKQTINSSSSLDANKGNQQLSFSQENSSSYKTGLSVEKNYFTETPKNRTSRPLRGMMAGPTASSAQECNKKRQTRKLCGSNPPQAKKEDNKDYLFPTTAPLSSMEVVNIECRKEKMGLSTHLVGFTGINYMSSLEQEEKGLRNTQRSDRQNDMSQAQKKISSTCKDDLKMGTMILDDINAEDEPCELSLAPVFSSAPQINVSTHPIDQDTANALKELLFGSSLGYFNEEWKAQSFTFSDVPGLTYGIIQKKGGPCGVLASLQACVLQKLLFENMSSRSACQKRQAANVEQRKCLVLAVAEILWRAGGGKMATVVISSGRQQFIPAGRYKSDGVMEMLTFNKVNNFEDLKLLLEHHIQQFEFGPSGCILLTISAILSRSIEMVRTDFDVPTNSLIGAHGYCSQELVNLLLCGQAVSNVFNNDVELDSGNGNITLLKGIKQQSDIGLLSLFEHYNICKVGPYLKTPKFPIWLVCSESHFTVLFCTCMELMSDWKKERKFDLYYYDGLANQQEEICLTISTMNSTRNCSQDVDNGLIPPLEHCIRTKWKDATVNWNGTEPIL
ncbi:hypothetical protein AAFF_G00354470 [Aldrovandia affinis]|uniref:Ubiquitin carboxyl-terminal hydrolase MINDY n=1 Tax=Aldrovandia affinis TaxID=143900 RepID=A0AAD7WNJ1_9TELE|nr:hypothetical protein AAFF_G00354470 [Aldrovandia affinis]